MRARMHARTHAPKPALSPVEPLAIAHTINLFLSNINVKLLDELIIRSEVLHNLAQQLLVHPLMRKLLGRWMARSLRLLKDTAFLRVSAY